MKLRQRLTSIWSLGRRAEVTVRVHYRVLRVPARPARENAGKTREIYQLKRMEEMEP